MLRASNIALNLWRGRDFETLRPRLRKLQLAAWSSDRCTPTGAPVAAAPAFCTDAFMAGVGGCRAQHAFQTVQGRSPTPPGDVHVMFENRRALLPQPSAATQRLLSCILHLPRCDCCLEPRRFPPACCTRKPHIRINTTFFGCYESALLSESSFQLIVTVKKAKKIHNDPHGCEEEEGRCGKRVCEDKSRESVVVSKTNERVVASDMNGLLLLRSCAVVQVSLGTLPPSTTGSRS